MQRNCAAILVATTMAESMFAGPKLGKQAMRLLGDGLPPLKQPMRHSACRGPSSSNFCSCAEIQPPLLVEPELVIPRRIRSPTALCGLSFCRQIDSGAAAGGGAISKSAFRTPSRKIIQRIAKATFC